MSRLERVPGRNGSLSAEAAPHFGDETIFRRGSSTKINPDLFGKPHKRLDVSTGTHIIEVVSPETPLRENGPYRPS